LGAQKRVALQWVCLSGLWLRPFSKKCFAARNLKQGQYFSRQNKTDMFNFLKTKRSYESVSARDFDKFMADHPDVVVLDVRTPGEFRQQSLKGAINIDVMGSAFASAIAKLDKSKSYLVYCRSGSRSASACGLMASNGFTSLYNLSGGIMGY
jgi:rhodanese-related sulfurtransferase